MKINSKHYDYIDIMFCVKCNKNTKHGFIDSTHERDSSQDICRCLICGNFQDPFEKEYERENI